MTHTIPTLDFREFSTNEAAFVKKFGETYEEFGFCGISHHGVDPALIDAAYEAYKAFFALPVETKMRYHLPGTGGRRGYTGFGIETAKDSKFPDLKEFWHVGPEVTDDPGYVKYAAVLPPNLWPAEVPSLREDGYALFYALNDLGTRVLSALALYLGLPRDFFLHKTDYGTSILRPIHYPPIAEGNTSSIRAGAHEDINLITLLVGSSAEGLQVLARDGQWVPITSTGDAIVVNIGDMLQRFSNKKLPSTTHRVVNPEGEKRRQPRYSIPFFLHPNADCLIDTLPSCIDADHPNLYPEPITAHDYLQQRLREIKLL